MKPVMLCLAISLGFGALSAGADSAFEDQKMYQLESPEVFEIPTHDINVEDMATTGDPSSRLSNCTEADRNAQPNAVDVGTVLKVGQVAWQIIEKNQPVIEVTPNTANALPKGVRCWQDLEGWQRPRSKLFGVVVKNYLGIEAVRFVFRVVYSHGGSFQTKGKYLSNVSVTAADTYAISTFELNANVEIPEVLNHGTKDNPLAGMHIVVKWSIKGKFQKIVQSAEFYVTGDGLMNQL